MTTAKQMVVIGGISALWWLSLCARDRYAAGRSGRWFSLWKFHLVAVLVAQVVVNFLVFLARLVNP